MLRLPLEKQQEMIRENEIYLKLWEESNSEAVNEKPSDEVIQLKLEMPLSDGLLKVNMGVPFIFVVNKSDIVNNSNDKKRYEEDSEFIFKHIRKLALMCKILFIYLIFRRCEYNIHFN